MKENDKICGKIAGTAGGTPFDAAGDGEASRPSRRRHALGALPPQHLLGMEKQVKMLTIKILKMLLIEKKTLKK